MLKKIQNVYSEIKDKVAFRAKVEKEFNITQSTCARQWFGGWNIPEKHYERVYTMVTEELQQQIDKQKLTLINN